MFEHLSVNESSGMPVWVQIRDQIYFQIKSGQVHAGDVLPTVRELAVRIGVNYNTVHKVYQDLEADGLILSGRGRRSRVAEEASHYYASAWNFSIFDLLVPLWGIPPSSMHLFPLGRF